MVLYLLKLVSYDYFLKLYLRIFLQIPRVAVGAPDARNSDAQLILIITEVLVMLV